MKITQLVAGLLVCTALFTGCSGTNRPSDNQTSAEAPQTSEPSVPTQEIGTPPAETEAITVPNFTTIKESGTITSNEIETLVQRVDWEAVSTDGITATVTVKVGITCYDISVGRREGSVTVNGETKTFTTQAIEHKIDEKKKFDFVNYTFTVELNENSEILLDIEAIWAFNEKYDGENITDLNASAKLPFPATAKFEIETEESTEKTVAENAKLPTEQQITP